jgi:hypothetical protein
MKPLPGSMGGSDLEYGGLVDDREYDSRELMEGMEGTSVQEKLVDTDFFNKFEVWWRAGAGGGGSWLVAATNAAPTHTHDSCGAAADSAAAAASPPPLPLPLHLSG